MMKCCLIKLDIIHEAFKRSGYITETRQLKVGGPHVPRRQSRSYITSCTVQF